MRILKAITEIFKRARRPETKESPLQPLDAIRAAGGVVREYSPIFHGSAICTWITAANADLLAMISGERPGPLTWGLLACWTTAGNLGFVIEDQHQRPLAFATLTRSEADLPPDCIEICHLIVNPDHRREKWGTRLLNYLAQLALQGGQSRVLGRVVASNAASLAMVSQPQLGFVRLDVHPWDNNPKIIWFVRTSEPAARQ